jgi:hypothetical protein
MCLPNQAHREECGLSYILSLVMVTREEALCCAVLPCVKSTVCPWSSLTVMVKGKGLFSRLLALHKLTHPFLSASGARVINPGAHTPLPDTQVWGFDSVRLSWSRVSKLCKHKGRDGVLWYSSDRPAHRVSGVCVCVCVCVCMLTSSSSDIIS